jgi:hypothetical protein
MGSRPVASRAVAALALAWVTVGCGGESASPSSGCVEGPATIERALARAPSPVTLAGGSRLSQCVQRARSEGDLQSVGAVLTQAADRLARRAPTTPRVALELGYLIGAVERGGERTNGIDAELVRRVEQDGGTLDRAPRAVILAFRSGLAAGRASG